MLTLKDGFQPVLLVPVPARNCQRLLQLWLPEWVLEARCSLGKGIQVSFEEGEITYLRSLDLKEPLLIQDSFWVSEDEDDQPGRPSKAVCILFREIMLLCRLKPESVLKAWDHTADDSQMDSDAITKTHRLSVYGYFRPYHIHRVNHTAVGELPQRLI